jgi:hypothetical protein
MRVPRPPSRLRAPLYACPKARRAQRQLLPPRFGVLEPDQDPVRDAADGIFFFSWSQLLRDIVIHLMRWEVFGHQSTMSSRDTRSALASAASTSALPFRLPASICDR